MKATISSLNTLATPSSRNNNREIIRQIISGLKIVKGDVDIGKIVCLNSTFSKVESFSKLIVDHIQNVNKEIICSIP